MSPILAKEFFKFVTTTLPNLLADHLDPVDALAELTETWKKSRTEKIEDRSNEVATDRANVDARLEERKQEAAKEEAAKEEEEKLKEKKNPVRAK